MAQALDFLKELEWRGQIQQHTPELGAWLKAAPRTAYIGADPTGPSLHIGNLATLMLLVHFQRAGHHPILLVGGATALIGDPSGKSAERQLLSEDQVHANAENIRRQMENLLSFDEGPNPARMVNNIDWFGQMGALQFLRDIGKHFTLSYMLSKESVTTRMESGISFTEFSYQLLQGHDFAELARRYDCTLQMGGSDQWGNICSGMELIRRTLPERAAHGLTCPLVTRADGAKFGKTAGGDNIYLDPELTSPYRFYQFWLNLPDEDMPKMLRTFSLKTREEIEALEAEQQANPGARPAQHSLAEELTVRLHSAEELRKARAASDIFFRKKADEALQSLGEADWRRLSRDVPFAQLRRDQLAAAPLATEVFAEAGLLKSKSEARRMAKAGGLRVNKQPLADPESTLSTNDLLSDRFLLLQSGKKNYMLVEFTNE